MDDEIEEMRQEDKSEKEEGHLSVLTLCTFRGLRWQLISIVVMMMGQQLSGVNGVSNSGVGLSVGQHWCRSWKLGDRSSPFTRDTGDVMGESA